MVAITFETEACSRCGGGGSYSFNLRDGDKCLKCNRSGLQTSRRGTAARKAYDTVMDGMIKTWSDVVAGDKVQIAVRKAGQGLVNRWIQVTSAVVHVDGKGVTVDYLTRGAEYQRSTDPVRVWDRAVYLAAVDRVRTMSGATVTDD